MSRPRSRVIDAPGGEHDPREIAAGFAGRTGAAGSYVLSGSVPANVVPRSTHERSAFFVDNPPGAT